MLVIEELRQVLGVDMLEVLEDLPSVTITLLYLCGVLYLRDALSIPFRCRDRQSHVPYSGVLEVIYRIIA